MPSLARSEPLYDQIYEILWAKILGSEIRPGARLRDVEWAEKLQVSRTPVREALRKMQKDGILESIGHGRYVLRGMGVDELRSLYRCRAVLEALCLRELEGPLPKKEISYLRKLIKETEACIKARDSNGVFKRNTEFHDILINKSRNTYLILLITNIKRMILFARASLRDLMMGEEGLSQDYFLHVESSQTCHVEIVEALAVSNFDAAARAMERHLFETGEQMQDFLSKVEP